MAFMSQIRELLARWRMMAGVHEQRDIRGADGCREIALAGSLSRPSLVSSENVDVFAIHTGWLSFKTTEGAEVVARSGEWQQIPGSQLYELLREGNAKIITAQTNGMVTELNAALDGKFVEAGTKLMTIKHPLEQKEIIENSIKEVLVLFPAPQSARYFFTMDIQSRIEKSGIRTVPIESGDEIVVMSLLKCDIPLVYNGERGFIYARYFMQGDFVARGKPLFGVCTPEIWPIIEKILARVKNDGDGEQ